MKITAVVCEFSPFHYGHEYLLKKIKEQSDAVICIMSGSFTERGEAAVLSAERRARAALMGGANLVLELPFPFSACGAEKFAFGGVSIADALGCVDELAFGSECGDAEIIKRTAENLSSEHFINALSSALGDKHEKPYSDIYFDVYRSVFGESPIFDGSNDILAVSYAKQLLDLGSEIKLRAIKREGESFSGDGCGFASASHIRKIINNGEDFSALVPSYSADEIRCAASRGEVYDMSRLFAPLAAIYRIGEKSICQDAVEINAELYNRIKNAFDSETSFDDVVKKSVTKRYSMSKVRRSILFSVLGVKAGDLEKVEFTKLLGADSIGREILSKIKKTSSIEIITKPSGYDSEAYALSKKADALYSLAKEKKGIAYENLLRSPVII